MYVTNCKSLITLKLSKFTRASQIKSEGKEVCVIEQ